VKARRKWREIADSAGHPSGVAFRDTAGCDELTYFGTSRCRISLRTSGRQRQSRRAHRVGTYRPDVHTRQYRGDGDEGGLPVAGRPREPGAPDRRDDDGPAMSSSCSGRYCSWRRCGSSS